MTTQPQKIYTQEELELMDVDVLDRMAYGVAGGETRIYKPTAIKIKWKDDLVNPQALFDERGMAWVNTVSFEEPVEVSVDDKGIVWLEDGHHRWFAASKLGRDLTAIVEVKGNPVKTLMERQRKALAKDDGGAPQP